MHLMYHTYTYTSYVFNLCSIDKYKLLPSGNSAESHPSSMDKMVSEIKAVFVTAINRKVHGVVGY